MINNKILWPTDFSENAIHALPYVTSLSKNIRPRFMSFMSLKSWAIMNHGMGNLIHPR